MILGGIRKLRVFGIVLVTFLIISIPIAVYIYADQRLIMTQPEPLATPHPEGGDAPIPALANPRIVITKSKRELEVFDGDVSVKTYAISLGGSPVGDKEIEGDGRTPEGDFYIFVKNPKSSFFLSLGLSYPNREDAERGLRDGLITKAEKLAIDKAIDAGRTPPQKTKLGGEIYIHGGGNLADWTEGCIAMRNKDIQQLYDAVGTGAPVTILP
jgi:murein L,D-transpeptidase YafK